MSIDTHFSRVAWALFFVGSAMMAEGFSTVEYVKVSRSIPIYSTIQEEVQSEQCYDVQEQVSSGTNNVGAAVVGGALGGILGHQIGGGSGKTAATVGGAVLGTLAGQRMGSAETNGPAYRMIRRCEPIRTLKTRQILSGYTNVAKFKGQEITAQSDRPLSEIPVTITYSY